MLSKAALWLAAFTTTGLLAHTEVIAEHPQGVWGNEQACELWQAGAPPKPEAAVYEVSEQWLQRYMFACYFGDHPPEQVSPGRWLTSVLCGEDGLRAYSVTLIEEPNQALSLIWQYPGDSFTHQVGPLPRCEPAQGNVY